MKSTNHVVSCRPALRQRWRQFAGALAIAVSAGILSACGGGSSGGGGGNVVGDFVRLVNEHRTSMGCAPVGWNSQLAAIAQTHSDDMAARNYFSHTTPDGITLSDRLRANGFSSGAENLAAGGFTGQSLLNSWLSSASHRVNIENCGWSIHGMGNAGSFYTHIFSG